MQAADLDDEPEIAQLSRKIVVKRARYQPARLGHFQTRIKRAKRSARLLPGAKEKPKRARRAFRVFPNARPLRKTRRFPLRRQIPVNIGDQK
jgi:hypothetical protein